MLDDALSNTFPASDPVSIVLPTPPADRAKVETSSWAALQFRKHRPELTAGFSNSIGLKLPTLISLRWL